MKILALMAENIKKLIAVEIKPDGNIVQITGKNGQGKTSVLDSIWWALAGASHIQATPIRKGAKTARIRLDLGEIIVTRTFKPGKHGGTTSSISVESKEGAAFKSPQGMLDGLLSALTFDPLGFARMSAREQFDQLKGLVSGVNFDKFAEASKADFDKRAELNRGAKEARAQAGGIVVPENAPDKVVDEMEMVKEMEEAAAKNSETEARASRREKGSERRIYLLKQADKIMEEAKDQFKKLTDEADEIEKKLKEADPLPELVKIADLREKIEAIRKDNDAAKKKKAKDDLVGVAERVEEESKILTEAMDAREEEKRKAVAAAKLPVEGITFGNGEILMDGVPFEQASDAEQLRASVAIAMSLNPKLRVLRVRDGSLLDEDSMKILAEMAADKDYQIWVERVDGSGKVGFVLEEGKVRKAEVAA